MPTRINFKIRTRDSLSIPSHYIKQDNTFMIFWISSNRSSAEVKNTAYAMILLELESLHKISLPASMNI